MSEDLDIQEIRSGTGGDTLHRFVNRVARQMGVARRGVDLHTNPTVPVPSRERCRQGGCNSETPLISSDFPDAIHALT